MGYQQVEVIVSSGNEEGFEVIPGRVLNGEILELDDEYAGLTIGDIEDIEIAR